MNIMTHLLYIVKDMLHKNILSVIYSLCLFHHINIIATMASLLFLQL